MCICSVSQPGELTLVAAPSTNALRSGDETERGVPSLVLGWGVPEMGPTG